jgi:hypothetical protein
MKIHFGFFPFEARAIQWILDRILVLTVQKERLWLYLNL